MPKMSLALLVFVAVAGTAWAEQPAISGKPDFSGKWRQESDPDNSRSALLIIEQASDTIWLRESSGSDRPETDLKCSVKAKDCSGRVKGHSANVVFYYNGDKLIQITRIGDNVTKIRRSLSADGETITVEIMPMAPYGKPEKVILVRSDPAKDKTSASLK